MNCHTFVIQSPSIVVYLLMYPIANHIKRDRKRKEEV